MGCCVSIKTDVFLDKELIVNLAPKEIENLMGSNRKYYQNTRKMKLRKGSSKTLETKAESPEKVKKRKKSGNFHNRITKDIAKNLRLFSIEEIKNIRKFFVLN